MNYKFLFKKELEKFLDTEMSIGEIMHTIFSEKVEGVKIKNNPDMLFISDEDWYAVLEESFKKIDTSTDKPLTSKEWKQEIAPDMSDDDWEDYYKEVTSTK